MEKSLVSESVIRPLYEGKAVISVEELASAFGISRTSAYHLSNSKGFPRFRVGRRCLISVEGLRSWIASQTGRGD